ncbi:THAP domain-containing protein 1-like [Linepithema humile]|uniref:THAP domain-containing protein 1-like n=1 Tax=Linepithema humile TaxID=83485 RepID=UPI00351E00F0
MVQCLLQSCKNRSDCQNWKQGNRKNVKITFHKFPKNPTTRAMWLESLGINLSSIPNTARICSAHFDEKFFDKTCSITQLKPNALPNRTLAIQQLSSNSTVVEQSTHDKNQISSSNFVAKSNIENPASITNDNIHDTTDHLLEPIVPTESINELPNIFPSQSLISKIDKATMVSPKRIYNSPKKSRLRRKIRFLEAEHAKKISYNLYSYNFYDILLTTD